MKELTNADVVVIGGGPAGLGAAIAAARSGADTLLLERHAFFGGIASFCVGMQMNQMRPRGEARSAVHELLLGKIEGYGEKAAIWIDHYVHCNVEYLKVAAFDALDEAACRYFVHAQVVDTLMEGNRITGVVVATKEGLQLVSAKCVVDCTGDADVAHYAGAETMKETGNLSPMTLCLNMSSADIKAAVVKWRDAQTEILARSRDDFPLIPPRWNGNLFSSDFTFFINHSGVRDIGQFDGSKVEDLTKAEVASRRQALQMLDTMRNSGEEELADLELIATGPQIGVRETRRVKGMYVLTEDDAMAGRSFDDAIAWRSGFLDIGGIRYDRMKVHDVPYRAIVPESTDGLLMAGRCISATHEAASAGKSMGNCIATGHAAGIAAAICADRNIQPREVPVADIQSVLRRDGVPFDRAGDAQDGLKQ